MDRSFSLEAHEACPGCEKHALSKGLFLAELQEMKKEMAELKKTIEVMQRTSTAVNARILSHLEGIRSPLVSPKLEFPLKTEEEMTEINNKIKETPSNYIEAFKKMVGPEGLEKNIERFFC
nr:uncharacterized protein LOC121502793 [Drosophila kikkawai]